MRSGIAWLATSILGKSTLICVVSQDLIQKGIKANEMVNSVALLADGKGGGKTNIAQAGVKSPEKLQGALSAAADIFREKIQIN